MCAWKYETRLELKQLTSMYLLDLTSGFQDREMFTEATVEADAVFLDHNVWKVHKC